MDLKVYLGELKNNPRFTEEMLQLVEEDLKFGLTPKETKQYTSKKMDFIQMKVISQCLRNGYPEEVLKVIANEKLTGEQMKVALEFYEKGISLPMIKKITGDAEKTAFTMKKLFQDILEKTGEAEKTAKQTESYEIYAKELVEQIKEAVEKIKFQEKRYDAFDEKLRELKTAEQDTKVQEHLLAQIAEKEQLLEKQQEELNAERVTIAKLRKEKEFVEKKLKDLEREKEEKKKEQKSEKIESEIVPTLLDGLSLEDKKESQNNHLLEQEKSASIFSNKYQAVILDSKKNVVRIVPVEGKKKRKLQRKWTTMFSFFSVKKELDMIKLIAEKKLETEQVIQIRSAIEKGLTKSQLLTLLNYPSSAEQMEELIKIAEYENKQRGESLWD